MTPSTATALAKAVFSEKRDLGRELLPSYKAVCEAEEPPPD